MLSSDLGRWEWSGGGLGGYPSIWPGSLRGWRGDIDWIQETGSRQEQGDEAILEQGEFEEAAGYPDNQQDVWV